MQKAGWRDASSSTLPPGFSSRPSGGWTGGPGRASISSNLMKAARRPISANGNCPSQAVGRLTFHFVQQRDFSPE
jgi:hypothetical protein